MQSVKTFRRYRHRGICVPRPVRLPEGLAAGLDSSDKRLDRSEQPREKIFGAALNLRAPRRDQGTARIFFTGLPIEGGSSPSHFKRISEGILLMSAVIHLSTDDLPPRHRL